MTIQEICGLLKGELLDNGYEYGFFLEGKTYKPNMETGFDREYYQLSTTVYRVQSPAVTMQEKIGTCIDTVMVMKTLLDRHEVPNTIWLLRHRQKNKVHTVLTFGAEGKIVYLELTPQSAKACYGHELVYATLQDFLAEFDGNGWDVSDVTREITIGQQPVFML